LYNRQIVDEANIEIGKCSHKILHTTLAQDVHTNLEKQFNKNPKPAFVKKFHIENDNFSCKFPPTTLVDLQQKMGSV